MTSSVSRAVKFILFSSKGLRPINTSGAQNAIDTINTMSHTRSRVSDCNKVTQRAGEAGSRVLRVPSPVFSLLASEQGKQYQSGNRVSLGDVVEAYIDLAGGKSPFGRKKRGRILSTLNP